MFSIKQNLFDRIGLAFLRVLFIYLIAHNSVHACLFVSMADNKSALVGYNEDFLELRTKIWFFPNTDSDYGRAIWGFNRALDQYQGGMNDQGLFVDMNAINNHSGWKADSKKANLDEDLSNIS